MTGIPAGPAVIAALASGVPARHPAKPSARVVDSTTAGDSISAAVLAACLEGADLAVAAGAGADMAARVIGQCRALVATG